MSEKPERKTATGWILRRPETLTGHVRSFGQMLTERQGERLPQ
ncbi:hypothetical protein [Streptomyces sp. NPDC002346]